MASVPELQDAFVAGDLQTALDGSRTWLTASLHLNPDLIAASSSLGLLCADISVGLDAPPMDQDLEATIAIFMQSIFEVNAVNELLLIADVLRITSPIPCELGLIWASFLAAMSETTEADKFLTRTLETLRAGILADPFRAEDLTALYETAYEILVSKVFLADTTCDVRAILRRIDADKVLRGSAKASLGELLESIEAPTVAPQAPSTAPSKANRSPRPLPVRTPAAPHSVLTDTSTQVMIGAVAVAAVCAIKYRSQLQASAHDVLQALGDIKGMLLG
ncbi:hypothetical protein SPRG_02419 [Saprolegnia parasitica CBS 223.65]|uniref:Uncharacterized protein n=1 Tax=Saprolegnia parasitica (strain CBS 223.65) TaxID=695850 RepID=A0A067D1X0_SAPPC|nr:hypothetical protein SPRG_02419 [Saprolegnia parasitica CBS 223.65]KDO32721.1 hypothetical protein SPRG_02419 [Saprolegnia parasitica CBS 223.65]|eukprot:XP_012196385.1 hypothetical protein SPRG_02419 [Saprolegnia parasitica CBS 223.65]